MGRIMGLFLLLVSETVILTALGWAGQDSWDYQKRTEDGWAYEEGVKGAPVSGHQVGIELLAVEAVYDGYQPKQNVNGDMVKVRFCQPESRASTQPLSEVKLTLRELQDFEHYVLNGASRQDGASVWGVGCRNVFPWHLQRAKSIVGDLNNIGAVVDLQRKGFPADAFVSPAFLYQEHHGCPRELVGYRIVLRSVRSTEILSRISDEASLGSERLNVRSSLKGGVPVLIQWDLRKPSVVPDGWYVLDVQSTQGSSVAMRKYIFHKNACQE